MDDGAWVNAIDANAMERVLLDYINNVAVLTHSSNDVRHVENSKESVNMGIKW